MSRKPAAGGEDDENAWPLAPDPDQPPPGKYLVAYRRARLVQRFKDRFTIELHFSIIEPIEWKERPLVLYCSTPLDGLPGRHSKYVTMWTLANGGPAKRRDRMKPSVFAGYWIAEVDHTRRRMVRHGGKDGVKELGPAETGTAVIVQLIERAAGRVQK